MTTNNPENDNVQQPSDEVLESAKSPGTLLREAREKANLSLEDVANRLNLRSQIIADIEQDCYDSSRSTTFAKGYVKSYARLLHLSEESVLNHYVEQQSPEIHKAELQSFSGRIEQETHDNRLKLLSYLVALIVVAMLVVWWWQEQSSLRDFWDSVSVAEESVSEVVGADDAISPTTEDISTIVLEPAATPEVPAIAPVVVVAEESADETLEPAVESAVSESVAQVEVSEPASVVEETPTTVVASASVEEPEKAKVEEPKAEEPKAEEPVNLLKLSFEANCWIQVTDSNGERLAIGEKPAGSSIELEGVPPYKLVLGAPNGVKLSYAGKSIDLSRFGKKVARLQVPE